LAGVVAAQEESERTGLAVGQVGAGRALRQAGDADCCFVIEVPRKRQATVGGGINLPMVVDRAAG
jgi:hypothetical protein